AYTATESNKEQDELIRSTGIAGTRMILAHLPETCKLVFPSTHVVFEGLLETAFELTEEHLSSPVLTYACGKDQSEGDINGCNSTLFHKNHI
ncbi:hypothetical protein ACI3PL_21210, partial [Lacticaseibacillus paracasei]